MESVVTNPHYLIMDGLEMVIIWKDELVTIICFLQILEGIPGYCLSAQFFLETTFFLMEI